MPFHTAMKPMAALYVLMDHPFHLLLETPETNLSRTMHWPGVSYSVWFN